MDLIQINLNIEQIRYTLSDVCPLWTQIQTTGLNVAVKVVSKKKLSEEDLAALITEISILCELDHPHIIK